VSLIGTQDHQLARLADAIAQRVGPQRFHVWFNNSTRLDLKQDGLEIAVPNDFISEWIGTHFTRPIQEAAHEVLGGPLSVRFCVMPELFSKGDDAILKKIGEEATETVMAAKDGDAQKLVYEVADLWFHSMLALSALGVTPADVLAELERREGLSGLEEFAARKAQQREGEEG